MAKEYFLKDYDRHYTNRSRPWKIPGRVSRIRDELEKHPEGLSITDIAGLLGINRNSVAKYMDILQVQGS